VALCVFVILFRAEEGRSLIHDFIQEIFFRRANELGMTPAPIEAPNLVGQNDPRNEIVFGNVNFPRIALLFIRDWTDDGKAHGSVVLSRREDEGRPPASLLMSDLRVEV
jgi:hypothetical protein